MHIERCTKSGLQEARGGLLINIIINESHYTSLSLCSMFPPKRSPHGHEHTQRKCRAVITEAPLHVQEARGAILINIIRNE